MTAPVAFTRPTYNDNDTLDAAAFNAVAAASATVRDATDALEGVVQLAGDLAGVAAAPTVKTTLISSFMRTVTAAASAAAARNLLGVNGFANRLDNPAFEVCQRTATTAPVSQRTYLPDRWFITPSGNAVSISIASAAPSVNSRYSLQIEGAASVTTVEIAQRLTAQRVAAGLATTVTFSAGIYNNTGAAFTPSLLVRCPTAADTWASSNTRLTQVLASCADGAWTTVSHSFDVSGLTDYANGLEIAIQFPSGLLVASKIVKLGEPSLTPGSTAAPFETLPYPLELARCQYHYERINFNTTTAPLGLAINASASTALAVATVPLAQPKRAAPVISFSDLTKVRLNNNGNSLTPGGLGTCGISNQNAFLTFNGLSVVAGAAYLIATDSNAVTLIVDAEL